MSTGTQKPRPSARIVTSRSVAKANTPVVVPLSQKQSVSLSRAHAKAKDTDPSLSLVDLQSSKPSLKVKSLTPKARR